MFMPVAQAGQCAKLSVGKMVPLVDFAFKGAAYVLSLDINKIE